MSANRIVARRRSVSLVRSSCWRCSRSARSAGARKTPESRRADSRRRARAGAPRRPRRAARPLVGDQRAALFRRERTEHQRARRGRLPRSRRARSSAPSGRSVSDEQHAARARLAISGGSSSSDAGSARWRSSSTMASGRAARRAHSVSTASVHRRRPRTRPARSARGGERRSASERLEQIGEQRPGAMPRDTRARSRRDARRAAHPPRRAAATCRFPPRRATRSAPPRPAASRSKRDSSSGELALAADEARRRLRVGGARPAPARRSSEPHQLEDRDLLGLALELQPAELAAFEIVARFAAGLAADVDRAEGRPRLEPRRHVDGVAEHVELADHPAAHVARDDGAGVDPDQRARSGTGEAADVLAQQVAHLERCAGRGAGRGRRAAPDVRRRPSARRPGSCRRRRRAGARRRRAAAAHRSPRGTRTPARPRSESSVKPTRSANSTVARVLWRSGSRRIGRGRGVGGASRGGRITSAATGAGCASASRGCASAAGSA